MSAKSEAKRQAFLKKLRKEMNEILRKPEREVKNEERCKKTTT